MIPIMLYLGKGIAYAETFLANGGYECVLMFLLLGAVLFTTGAFHGDLTTAKTERLAREARRKRVLGK